MARNVDQLYSMGTKWTRGSILVLFMLARSTKKQPYYPQLKFSFIY
jgi:hypothetical protein